VKIASKTYVLNVFWGKSKKITWKLKKQILFLKNKKTQKRG